MEQFSEKAKSIRPGVYRHYKGNEYEVIGVGRNEADLTEVVIYKAFYGDKSIWVRLVDSFTEEVEVDGQTVPRFTLVEEK